MLKEFSVHVIWKILPISNCIFATHINCCAFVLAAIAIYTIVQLLDRHWMARRCEELALHFLPLCGIRLDELVT